MLSVYCQNKHDLPQGRQDLAYKIILLYFALNKHGSSVEIPHGGVGNGEMRPPPCGRSLRAALVFAAASPLYDKRHPVFGFPYMAAHFYHFRLRKFPYDTGTTPRGLKTI